VRYFHVHEQQVGDKYLLIIVKIMEYSDWGCWNFFSIFIYFDTWFLKLEIDLGYQGEN
jgi:hypothetical protein